MTRAPDFEEEATLFLDATLTAGFLPGTATARLKCLNTVGRDVANW